MSVQPRHSGDERRHRRWVLGFAPAAVLVVALLVYTLGNPVSSSDQTQPPESAGALPRHVLNKPASPQRERVAPLTGVARLSGSARAAPPSLVTAAPAGPPALVAASGPQTAADGGLVPFTIDRDGIQSAIREKLPDIHECYAAWQQQNPALAGRIVVAFEVSADNAGTGEVTRVEVLDGGIGHPFMEGCILNAFQELRFDEPPGGGSIKVRYPIHFEPPLADGG